MNEKAQNKADGTDDEDPTTVTGEASFGVHEDFEFNNDGEDEALTDAAPDAVAGENEGYKE